MDYLVRATTHEGHIRALASTTRELAEEARERHHTSAVATAALGRLLTAAALMGADLEGEDNLTLRLLGNGPLGALVAVAEKRGVKGYVQQPDIELPLKSMGKLDVGKAVGHEGMLYVTKSLGLKEPYVSGVNLVSGEIAEDLAYYFAHSEQIPTVVALGVLIGIDRRVAAAGGFLLQAMPGATEKEIEELEARARHIGAITHRLNLGQKPEEILEELLDGFDFEITPPEELSYFCHCSRQKVEEILVSLGHRELKSMIEEDRKAEVKCQFCGEKYDFSADDLAELLEQVK